MIAQRAEENGATGLREVYHYTVEGDGKSLAELRTVQDWVFRPQIRSVRGVAEVNTWGGDERQIHVVVDPTTLSSRALTLGCASHRLKVEIDGIGVEFA